MHEAKFLDVGLRDVRIVNRLLGDMMFRHNVRVRLTAALEALESAGLARKAGLPLRTSTA